MIRTTIERGLLRFEIDGKGGKAWSTLTPESALSLRRRIGNLVADLVEKGLDDGEEFEEVIERRHPMGGSDK